MVYLVSQIFNVIKSCIFWSLCIWNVIEQQCLNGEASLGSPLNGKLFVLVGAGGAGRALAFGAKSRGARIVVFDIDFGI